MNIEKNSCGEKVAKISYRPYLIFFILLWMVLAYSIETAHSKDTKKMALLIGNADYSFSPLRNPLNDAGDLNRRLASLGFETTMHANPSSEEFQSAITSFYSVVSKDPETLSIFYYAGHAIQMNNVNYMIPVDAKITDHDTLVKESISINELLLAMAQTNNQKNLVILDACRVNPFKQISSKDQSRGVELPDATIRELQQGLAPVEAPVGTIIAYATAPGNVAKDGKGRNGTYTKYLLEHLDKHQPIEEIFKLVREDVMKATSGKQIPWEHSSLYKKVYFYPPRNKNIPEIGGF
jgi:uncharacterized caspase-like protein